MATIRNNFRDCSIFTSDRSLQSIVEAIDFFLDGRQKTFEILDAFCGDGIVGEGASKYFSSLGKNYKLTFVDKNPSALDSIKIENAIKKSADLRENIDYGKFDIIIERYGLHDLAVAEKKKALTSLVNSLKENGRIILCDIMPCESDKLLLTKHHQNKEDVCEGPNKNVYLSTPEEYLSILNDFNIKTNFFDYFLEEVYLRNWLGTLGVSKNKITEHEKYVSNFPKDFKEKFQVFESKKGIKMYYPVGTIIGIKNE